MQSICMISYWSVVVSSALLSWKAWNFIWPFCVLVSIRLDLYAGAPVPVAQIVRGPARGQHGASTGPARGQHGASTGPARGQHGGSTGAARGQHGGSTGAARGATRGATGCRLSIITALQNTRAIDMNLH